MKKIYNKAKPGMSLIPQYRSLRRFVKNVFASFIKNQVSAMEDEFQREVRQKLQDIEDMIAREMGRQSRLGK